MEPYCDCETLSSLRLDGCRTVRCGFNLKGGYASVAQCVGKRAKCGSVNGSIYLLNLITRIYPEFPPAFPLAPPRLLHVIACAIFIMSRHSHRLSRILFILWFLLLSVTCPHIRKGFTKDSVVWHFLAPIRTYVTYVTVRRRRVLRSVVTTLT